MSQPPFKKKVFFFIRPCMYLFHFLYIFKSLIHKGLRHHTLEQRAILVVKTTHRALSKYLGSLDEHVLYKNIQKLIEWGSDCSGIKVTTQKFQFEKRTATEIQTANLESESWRPNQWATPLPQFIFSFFFQKILRSFSFKLKDKRICYAPFHKRIKVGNTFNREH